MKTYYTLSIPEPCHKNWDMMTPNQKGRFCDSCSKTVIDFTRMNFEEIQDYIHNNLHQRICGHIRKDQLKTIYIKIPESVFNERLPFHKMFLLVLLLTMGTTLLNCTNTNGKTQKIDNIEVVDSTVNNSNTIKTIDTISEVDSKKDCSPKTPIPPPYPVGMIETDSTLLGETEISVLTGLLIPEVKSNGPFNFWEVDTPPSFKHTPKEQYIQELKDSFQSSLANFVLENFRVPQGDLGLSGKQKINVQFKIDSLGFVKEVRARAPHIIFEKEAKRVIELLPQFVPAKYNHKSVSIIYSLPIIFQVED